MAIAAKSRRHDRRQTTQRNKERASKSKGRWFGKRVAIPEEPIRIHFQKPTEPYSDPWNPEDHYFWKKGAKHYIKKLNKFTECALDECLTCAYKDPQKFGFDPAVAVKFLEKSWPSEYYSLGVLVDEWYCIVEREGKKRNDDGTPRTFMERVLEKEAKREIKEAGYDPKEVDLPRVYGFKGFLDISSPAWHNEFAAMYEKIERHTTDGKYLIPMFYGCSECATPLFPVGAECPNCGSEECGVSQDDSGNLTHKMFCNVCESEWELLEHESKPLKKQADSVYQCEECKHKGYAVPLFSKYDPETGELDDQEPETGWETMDLFDVQVTLRTSRSTDSAPPKMVIDRWEFADNDPRHFDPKYQGEGEDAEKIAERNREPFDLEAIHSPDDPAAQSKILQLDNLFSSGGSGPRKAIRYSRNTEATQEATE